MKRRLSIPLLLCALLLVYTLVSPPPELIQEPEPTDPDARIPDSYAFGVTLTTYDQDGALNDRTDAQALRRFRREALVEFDEPRREGHRGDANWVAKARSGTLQERREVLTLLGDVRLNYLGEGVTFTTESLVLNLDKQTARSQAPVQMWQGENETRALNLIANLDREVATLNGKVRSVYVPTN